jgi:hypothetical protein
MPIDPAKLAAYAGRYPLTPWFVLTVTPRGGRLMVQATGLGEQEVFPESDTRFFSRVVDAQITFERARDRTAAALVLHQNGRNRRAARPPWYVAESSALIGASNLFELAVATAITLFGLQSAAALATVVSVPAEVPIMLSVVHTVRRSRRSTTAVSAPGEGGFGFQGSTRNPCFETLSNTLDRSVHETPHAAHDPGCRGGSPRASSHKRKSADHPAGRPRSPLSA